MVVVVGAGAGLAWTENLNQRQKAVILSLCLLCAMLCIVGVIWCLYTLKQIKYRVVVGGEGIARIPESAPAVSVGWSDIVAVEDRMRANRLRLYGVGKRLLMEFDWQLENADKLEEVIHQKVYRDRLVHEGVKRFRVRKGANTFGVLPPIGFVWFSLLSGMQGAYIPSAVFAAMAVGALLSWGNLIQEVAIMAEGLQLRTLLKLRSIGWPEISGIDMSTVKDERPGGSGRAYRVVKVLLKNGKPIRMPPVQEGNLLLFDALSYEHRVSQS
ncbi:MAG TPA: hypothetical protein PK224_19920 [Nitrospira sp.]|nr:hypothetical protein [Nitrospira sp.]